MHMSMYGNRAKHRKSYLLMLNDDCGFYNSLQLCGFHPYSRLRALNSARNRKASQSPHDIFQLLESVIVGNTLPAEVPASPRKSQHERSDAIYLKLIGQ